MKSGGTVGFLQNIVLSNRVYFSDFQPFNGFETVRTRSKCALRDSVDSCFIRDPVHFPRFENLSSSQEHDDAGSTPLSDQYCIFVSPHIIRSIRNPVHGHTTNTYVIQRENKSSTQKDETETSPLQVPLAASTFGTTFALFGARILRPTSIGCFLE